MPTPIGHALAGLAVAWSAEPPHGLRRLGRALVRPLPLVCMALAALPDVDLVYPPLHRTVTHSIGAVILVLIIAVGVTRWVTGRIHWRIAAICTAAYATHIATDWLGTDRSYAPYGIQMFWPFDSGWYISGWDVFLPVERRQPFSMATIRMDVAAGIREIAILGLVVAVIGLSGSWLRTSSRRRAAKPPRPRP